MEVINELNTKDINTSLLRLKKDLIVAQENVDKIINDTNVDLSTKYNLVNNFRDKVITYNRVLDTLIKVLNEYFNEHYITIWNLSLSQWISQYKTNLNCTYENSHEPNYYLDENLELGCESCDTSCNSSYTQVTCSSCNASCNHCNSEQSSCSSDYNKDKSMGEVDDLCSNGYTQIGCTSAFSIGCYSCYSSCDDGYSISGGF